MAIKPDIFLLIVLSGGLCIIIIGMIIAINCPLSYLSCCCCCQKISNLFRRGFSRRGGRKEKSWSKSNILSFPETAESHKSYGLTLVEGRPQGHGFYTAGPSLSSAETTSTCVGTDVLQKISLMTQMGLVGSEYYSAVLGSPGGVATALNSSNMTALSPNIYKPLSLYSNFMSSSSGETGDMHDLGFHGDNSINLNTQLSSQIQHPTICLNCKGIGFLPGDSAVLPLEQIDTTGNQNNFEESSSSSDSALSSSAEMDADADMIICM